MAANQHRNGASVFQEPTEETEDNEMAQSDKTIEYALKRLEEMEALMRKNKEAEKRLIKKHEEMESEILKCQEELMELKRAKVEARRQLEESNTEIEDLRVQMDDLRSVPETEPQAVEDLPSNDETNRLLLEVEEQGSVIEELTEQFNSGMNRLDQMEERFESLQRICNRGKASFQATEDLEDEKSPQ